MFERFDEAELLALVEGELDPKRARALELELAASDPRALEIIERMRADRRILGAVEPPEVPDDLLAELEPLIARPMLMPPPGQVRRRYRRQQRRRWLPLAAGVVVALGAGVWGTIWIVSSLSSSLFEPSVEPFEVATETTTPVPPAPPAVEEPEPPVQLVQQPAPTPPARREAERPAPVPSGGVQTAGFRLVLHETDTAAVEDLLARALVAVDARHALVRNLTMAEAQRLSEGWQRDRAKAARELAAARAAADGAALPRRDLRVRPHDERSVADAVEPETPPSAQLAGPRDLAPSFEQQLEFSADGCVYTISVPLAGLERLLAHLQIVEGRETTLQSLDEMPPGAGIWMDDYARVRRDLQRLRSAGADVIVHVPVRVE